MSLIRGYPDAGTGDRLAGG